MEQGKVVGTVRSIYRYPVKSMRGEELREANIEWYGLDGDRRYAFVQRGNLSNFPWLTGRQVPRMILYTPYFSDPADPDGSPVRVKTPDGENLALESGQLQRQLAEAHGAPVDLLHVNRGLFDSMPVSLISLATIAEIGAQAGISAPLDPRRFRPNILVETAGGEPLEESWLEGLLIFGNREDSAALRLNRNDRRCMMVNLEPQNARQTPAVLRGIAQNRDNCAGIYGSTERPGSVRVGDAVRLTSISA